MTSNRSNPIRKVVVASLPRTASTLMCEALAQHPAVLGCGEVFIHEESGRAYYHKKACSDLRYYPGAHRFTEYIRYLEAAAALEGRDILSFKLMDYQEPVAWEMVAADPSVSIVHTRRENVLECLASSLASHKSGAWHGHDAGQLAKATEVLVEVSPAELIEWHERKLAFDRFLAALPNPRLVVEYGEIANDYEGTIGRVFEFLRLTAYCAIPTQQKLNPRPLSERIVNFNELRQNFAGSDLEHYFEGRN